MLPGGAGVEMGIWQAGHIETWAVSLCLPTFTASCGRSWLLGVRGPEKESGISAWGCKKSSKYCNADF